MICINSKEWSSLTSNDIIDFLSSPETEESFFFEFKEDRVDPKKLAEEISAFANTYGGFIFLGITDLKKVDGCSLWNEQRIHNDRIPKTGLYTIDKHSMQQCGIDDYTSNTIIHELFFSQFVEMSLPSANNK